MAAIHKPAIAEYQLDDDTPPPLDDMLNFGDETLFPEFWDLQDTPLYSQEGFDPISQPWNHMPSSPPRQPNAETVQAPGLTSLTVAQQELLRSIAMPAHLQYPSTREISPQSATSTGQSGTMSSPDNQGRSRKRKSSTEGAEDDISGDDSSQRPVKKTAHNMIEKRYRTNLNDKIMALRDSVPSLRVMTKGSRGGDGSGETEDLEGLVPAHKLNKATVLSKATEYICHLEKRSKRLAEENTSMKARLAAFEKLFLSGSMGINPTPPPQNQFAFEEPIQFVSGHPGQINTPVSAGPVYTGVVGSHQNFRRAHRPPPMNPQTYQMHQVPPHQQQNRMQGGTNAWSGNGAYFGKIMVGSLAGLMVMDGFSESQSTGGPGESRGLFAVPTQLLGNAARYVRESGDISIFGYHSSAAQTLGYLRLLLILGALLFVFVPSFFASPSHSDNSKTIYSVPSASPSLASPIQLRRRAWLTAIQTVWVPRHTFLLEAAALCLKIAKLSLRSLIGTHTFTFLMGTSEQQEAARVKAWTIALDAQLVGGDVEVSKSRLTLTLLASATLPVTPARLMLQALHLRVLLWEVGTGTYMLGSMVRSLATHLAHKKWNEARELHQLLKARPGTADTDPEPLPPHLLALLTNDAAAVLTDTATQCAYNLAMNITTPPSLLSDAPAILDDRAIRSPLDALAASFSSTTLHDALESSLLSTPPDLTPLLNSAVSTSPLGSTMRVRALAALALLVPDSRSENIKTATQEAAALDPPPPTDPDAPPALLLTSPSAYVPVDVHLALECAAALQLLAHPTDRALAFPAIGKLVQPRSVLGFAGCYAVLCAMKAGEGLRAKEVLAGRLRIGVGSAEGAGVRKEVREEVVKVCVGVIKTCVMEEEEDTGYASMSEEES